MMTYSSILNWSSYIWRIVAIRIKFILSLACMSGQLHSDELDEDFWRSELELLVVDLGVRGNDCILGVGILGVVVLLSLSMILFLCLHLWASRCIGDRLSQSCCLQPGPFLHMTRKGESVLSKCRQS